MVLNKYVVESGIIPKVTFFYKTLYIIMFLCVEFLKKKSIFM